MLLVCEPKFRLKTNHKALFWTNRILFIQDFGAVPHFIYALLTFLQYEVSLLKLSTLKFSRKWGGAFLDCFLCRYVYHTESQHCHKLFTPIKEVKPPCRKINSNLENTEIVSYASIRYFHTHFPCSSVTS